MATRADNKDGSCREILTGRHRGKWRIQYSVQDELGKSQRLSRLFSSKTAGKEFLQGLRHGAKVSAARTKKELTLGGWFDWLAENDWPEELAERTIAGRVSRFDRFVRKAWGDVPLTKIDPLVVHAFYRKLKEDEVGAPTILEIKRDLVRVFNQAINPYRRVPMNLANPFTLRVETPAKRDAVALAPEQAKKALESKDLDDLRRGMLGVFLLAGLRLGEQMALTRGQLLFDQNLIYIDRAVQTGKTGQQWVGLPKGGKKRLAVMCPSLKAFLQAIAADLGPDDLLWPAASENKPRMKKLVYATWRTIVSDAKLPKEMTPHDSRLSFVNWIEKLMPEVSVTTLKETVGHASQGVTEAHYTRPLTPAQEGLAAAIERIVFGVGKGS